jgi:hypothetical protein
MKEGPKVRGEPRKGYAVNSGGVVDVYPLILRAIALNPPELTQRYPNLQKRIQYRLAYLIERARTLRQAWDMRWVRLDAALVAHEVENASRAGRALNASD